MAQVIWTDESKVNLREIHAYIAMDNPPAAARTIDGIFDRVDQIAESPLIGHVVEWESERLLRSLNFGHYRIVYLASGSKIVILGVFHGAVDIRRKLSPPSSDPAP